MPGQRVFISFSTADRAIAARLHGDLRARGAEAFQFERSATPGSAAWEEVVEAIDQSEVFLLLASKAALESRAVREELNRAYYRRVNGQWPEQIIPLTLKPDAPRPPLAEHLSTLPFHDYAAGLEALCQQLELGPAPESHPTSASSSTQPVARKKGRPGSSSHATKRSQQTKRKGGTRKTANQTPTERKSKPKSPSSTGSDRAPAVAKTRRVVASGRAGSVGDYRKWVIASLVVAGSTVAAFSASALNPFRSNGDSTMPARPFTEPPVLALPPQVGVGLLRKEPVALRAYVSKWSLDPLGNLPPGDPAMDTEFAALPEEVCVDGQWYAIGGDVGGHEITAIERTETIIPHLGWAYGQGVITFRKEGRSSFLTTSHLCG